VVVVVVIVVVVVVVVVAVVVVGGGGGVEYLCMTRKERVDWLPADHHLLVLAHPHHCSSREEM